jgi:hypothetical protein
VFFIAHGCADPSPRIGPTIRISGSDRQKIGSKSVRIKNAAVLNAIDNPVTFDQYCPIFFAPL